MARGQVKWTETKIQKMIAEGFGRGKGASYRPWLEVTMVSSLGRSRRVWSPKTDRVHHLLSDVEYNLFLALEWPENIIDIREQYPLDRVNTQEIARLLGIRHPCYVGTDIPTVMTVDFLATKRCGTEITFEAFNAKRDEEADDETSLLKLEVQRAYFELIDVPHHVVYHSQIPKQKVENIDWIRAAHLKPKEVEPRPGFFSGLTARMAAELNTTADQNLRLAAFCQAFDTNHGLEKGTGLRVACMLMHERVLMVNLASPNLAEVPLSSFVMTVTPGQLRAVGGR